MNKRFLIQFIPVSLSDTLKHIQYYQRKKINLPFHLNTLRIFLRKKKRP